MPALLAHHFGGYSKMRYKKLVTHVESHARAKFARERRIALHKSDQQRQQQQQQRASKAHNCNYVHIIVSMST